MSVLRSRAFISDFYETECKSEAQQEITFKAVVSFDGCRQARFLEVRAWLSFRSPPNMAETNNVDLLACTATLPSRIKSLRTQVTDWLLRPGPALCTFEATKTA